MHDAPPEFRTAWLRSTDRVISNVVEAIASALVVAEVLLLGSGTVARYVFDAPFPWSDELGSLLFIWLAVLMLITALRNLLLLANWRQMLAAVLVVAIPGLGLPVVIRSAVVEGVATATEVSTIGVLYTVVVGLVIYRQFDWKRVYPILVETASLSGAILLVALLLSTLIPWISIGFL